MEKKKKVGSLYRLYIMFRIAYLGQYMSAAFSYPQYILNSCLNQENPYCLRLLFHFNTHCLTFLTIHKNRRHARGVLCIFVLFLFVVPIILVMPVKQFAHMTDYFPNLCNVFKISLIRPDAVFENVLTCSICTPCLLSYGISRICFVIFVNI